MAAGAPSVHSRWRLSLAWLTLLAGVGSAGVALAWFDRLESRPTPRPAGFEGAALGLRPSLPPTLAALVGRGRPALLHFLDLDCAPARFNLEHLRHLVEKHHGRVRVVAVLSGADPATSTERFAELGLGIPWYVDGDLAVARACGVWVTPQATILGPEGRLLYRGGYNVAPYCRDAATAFVERTLETLLAERELPEFGAAAQAAFGCELVAGKQGAQ